MKLEIPIKVVLKGIDELIEELKALQTYKLSEDDEMILVSLDDVVEVFANHIVAINDDTDSVKVTNRNDTISRQDAIDAMCDEFSYIYCHNCSNQGSEDDSCEDCHRKYMSWSISRETVERVINALPSAQPDYYDISDIDDMWEYYAEEHDLNLSDNAKQIKEAMWIGYQKGKKNAQPDRMAITKEKILQCISELEENGKYHAEFVQKNGNLIAEGLRMALDFMMEGEEHD